MNIRIVRIGALAALLAFGVACGDDDDSDSDSAADTEPTEEAESTEEAEGDATEVPADYLADANAICAKYNTESDTLTEGFDEADAENPEAVQKFFKDVLALSFKSVDELRDLTLPEGDVGIAVQDLYDELEGLLGDAEEAIATPESAMAFAQTEDDPFTEINQKFTALGFDECGSEE